MNRLILAAGAGALMFVLRAAAAAQPESADTWSSPPAKAGGEIVFRVATAVDDTDDPAAAGKRAAESLCRAMGQVPLRAVIVSECFEDRAAKEKLLSGVCSVLPKDAVFGQSTYGSFSQAGSTDADSVTLLGIGGDGVGVNAALVTELGAARLLFDQDRAEIQRRLHAAGKTLAGKLTRTAADRLLVALADAHSPKNQFLVQGLQEATGPTFAITGGSANKNAGQTFVYFRGRPYADSAVAAMLSGDFRLAMAGRQAKDNDRVIATAKEAAAEALGKLQDRPLAVLAFDCAGRRGKLNRIEEELAAIQEAVGKTVPLFGCYCAGEIGPLDTEEKRPGVASGGTGWHMMVTVIGR